MIKKASIEDLDTLTGLALKLWPEHTYDALRRDLEPILMGQDAAFFLADAVGFAQCQLRRDYVEGTESSPVGYLEGIFVAPEHRHRGIARQLLAACEAWAKDRGCREFASDCELHNTDSLRFHLSNGFTEVNRIICFVKELK